MKFLYEGNVTKQFQYLMIPYTLLAFHPSTEARKRVNKIKKALCNSDQFESSSGQSKSHVTKHPRE